MYVLFRQNIGTCITAVLASIGTGRNAKRTTIIHLMFNMIGTLHYIDFLNKEISKHISQIITYEVNEGDSAAIGSFFRITGNLERIGDHAINICEYSRRRCKSIGIKNGSLSKRTILCYTV